MAEPPPAPMSFEDDHEKTTHVTSSNPPSPHTTNFQPSTTMPQSNPTVSVENSDMAVHEPEPSHAELGLPQTDQVSEAASESDSLKPSHRNDKLERQSTPRESMVFPSPSSDNSGLSDEALESSSVRTMDAVNTAGELTVSNTPKAAAHSKPTITSQKRVVEGSDAEIDAGQDMAAVKLEQSDDSAGLFVHVQPSCAAGTDCEKGSPDTPGRVEEDAEETEEAEEDEDEVEDEETTEDAESDYGSDTPYVEQPTPQAVLPRKPKTTISSPKAGRKRSPVANTKEAVRREVENWMRKRELRRETARQKEQQRGDGAAKRKHDGSPTSNATKVSRNTEVDDAAKLSHSQTELLKQLPNTEAAPASRQQQDSDSETVHEAETPDLLDFEVKLGVSRSAPNNIDYAKRIFGAGKAEKVPGGLKIEGITDFLWPEQASAVRWMIYQEEIPVGPRGGILAADMGTGKTIMSLATIVSNQPDESDLLNYSNATLVVVPNQKVARQWMDKIVEHCDPGISRKAQMLDPKNLKLPLFYKKLNIVITTYHQVCSQEPSYAANRKLAEHWHNTEWRQKIEKVPSKRPLFHIDWFRIILDEAHKISNKDTATFRACSQLRGKNRWCLSGTPLANSDEELYPYLRFLVCDFAKKIGKFFEKFKTELETTTKVGKRPNLDALMDLILYRYKVSKNISIGGDVDMTVPMSVEENLIYNEVKPIMGKKPSKALRKRQAVSHFFNLERMYLNDFQRPELRSLLAKFTTLEDRIPVLHLIRGLAQKDSEVAKFSSGITQMAETGDDMIIGDFNFEPLLRKFLVELKCWETPCSNCGLTGKPWLHVRAKNCPHIYCSKCLNSQESCKQTCVVENCGKDLVYSRHAENLCSLSSQAASNETPSAGLDMHGTPLIRLGREHPAHLLSAPGKVPVPPSTKLAMALAVLLTWRQESPDDKIVVFLDNLTSAKVLGQLLQKVGETFLYMFGNIGDLRGQVALDKFKSSDSASILLAGLRSCSEALNLTEANRVVIVDLWWNRTKEKQAFGRVHRIGQKKATHVVRIVSEGDVRIMELQKRKLKEINYALNEDGHKRKTLKGGELNALFAGDSSETEEEEEEVENDDDDDGYGDEEDEPDEDYKPETPIRKMKGKRKPVTRRTKLETSDALVCKKEEADIKPNKPMRGVKRVMKQEAPHVASESAFPVSDARAESSQEPDLSHAFEDGNDEDIAAGMALLQEANNQERGLTGNETDIAEDEQSNETPSDPQQFVPAPIQEMQIDDRRDGLGDEIENAVQPENGMTEKMDVNISVNEPVSGTPHDDLAVKKLALIRDRPEEGDLTAKEAESSHDRLHGGTDDTQMQVHVDPAAGFGIEPLVETIPTTEQVVEVDKVGTGAMDLDTPAT